MLFSTAAGGKSVYGVFGEPLGTAPPTNSATEPVVYAFTGREYDTESGYYYYRARYYDPVSARFLTKDPLGPEAGGDINPYRYVMNSPVNYTDPTGMVVADMTGGRIPKEVIDTDIYRSLDNRPNPIAIAIDYSLPNGVYGNTSYANDGSQLVRINPQMHSSRADLLDTYVHELNHADLNIPFRGKTPEWTDTDAVLPSVMQNNFGRGGPRAGVCPY